MMLSKWINYDQRLQKIVDDFESYTNVLDYLEAIGWGGVHPDYFVKLDFEIAVDQQTRARDRTFEGVPDSG